MPTKSFWEWQRQSKLCHDCTEEPKDCMRCEIVWDAALKYKEAQPQADNSDYAAAALRVYEEWESLFDRNGTTFTGRPKVPTLEEVRAHVQSAMWKSLSIRSSEGITECAYNFICGKLRA